MAERSPPFLGDPHARDLHRLAARDHALGRRGREPGVDDLDHLNRESVCDEHGLRAAVALVRVALAIADDLNLDC
jgi:hypothetical protein